MNNLIYFGGISAFYVGFLQYRKDKERDIISNYIKDKQDNNSMKNFIYNYKLLSSIIKNQKNFDTIIMNEIYDVINSNNFDNFKQGIKVTLLEINGEIGDINYIISIFKDMINNENKLKKTLKRQEDIDKININIERISYIEKLFKESNEIIFIKPCLFEKILNFLKP